MIALFHTFNFTYTPWNGRSCGFDATWHKSEEATVRHEHNNTANCVFN